MAEYDEMTTATRRVAVVGPAAAVGDAGGPSEGTSGGGVGGSRLDAGGPSEGTSGGGGTCISGRSWQRASKKPRLEAEEEAEDCSEELGKESESLESELSESESAAGFSDDDE